MTAHAMKSFDTALFAQKESFDAGSLMTGFSSARAAGHWHGTQNRSADTPVMGLEFSRALHSEGPSAPSLTRNESLSVATRAALCNALLDAIEANYDDGAERLLQRNQIAPDLACVPVHADGSTRAGAIAPQRVQAKSASLRRSRPTVAVTAPIQPAHPTSHVERICQMRQGAGPVAAPRQRAQPRPVALGLPQTEARDLSILRDVFAPEHDLPDTPTGAQALPHRLAIYALNASLVFTILPYGAAFLH